MSRPIHYDGDPDGCAEDCRGPHYEDAAPEVCEECGGNGRSCMFGCIDRRKGRAYEPYEGRTAADEAFGPEREWEEARW